MLVDAPTVVNEDGRWRRYDHHRSIRGWTVRLSDPLVTQLQIDYRHDVFLCCWNLPTHLAGDELEVVNYLSHMTTKKVDPAELVDAHVVASILGLSSPSAVSVYRKRYDDFPQPVVDMGKGRCLLWHRQYVERWRAGRGK